MPTIRPRKETDQDETEKAYWLIRDVIAAHPEIESSLWFGAVMTLTVDVFYNNGYSFTEFRQMMLEAVDHYKEEYEST